MLDNGQVDHLQNFKTSLDWHLLINKFLLGLEEMQRSRIFWWKKLLTDQMVFTVACIICEKTSLIFFPNDNWEAILWWCGQVLQIMEQHQQCPFEVAWVQILTYVDILAENLLLLSQHVIICFNKAMQVAMSLVHHVYGWRLILWNFRTGWQEALIQTL